MRKNWAGAGIAVALLAGILAIGEATAAEKKSQDADLGAVYETPVANDPFVELGAVYETPVANDPFAGLGFVADAEPPPPPEPIALLPDTLPEFLGIKLGTPLIELIQKYDARETTGVPEDGSEFSAISARGSLEQAHDEGFRIYRIKTRGVSIDVHVDEITKKVYWLRRAYPPTEFLPLVLSFSKAFGKPNSTVFLQMLTAGWLGEGQRGFSVSLHITTGKLRESIGLDGDHYPIFEKVELSLLDGSLHTKSSEQSIQTPE